MWAKLFLVSLCALLAFTEIVPCRNRSLQNAKINVTSYKVDGCEILTGTCPYTLNQNLTGVFQFTSAVDTQFLRYRTILLDLEECISFRCDKRLNGCKMLSPSCPVQANTEYQMTNVFLIPDIVKENWVITRDRFTGDWGEELLCIEYNMTFIRS